MPTPLKAPAAVGSLRGLFAALLFCALVAPAQVVVDNFDKGQAWLSAPGSSAVSGTMLGTERDLAAAVTSGGPVNAEVENGTFVFVQDVTAVGSAEIVWDGADGSSALNATGLGSQNLTSGSQNAFLLGVLSASQTVSATLEVYNSGGVRTLSFSIPAGSAPNYISLLQSAFGGTGDFTAVGAIRLIINSTPGATLVLDFLRTHNTAATPAFEGLLTDIVLNDLDGNGKASPGDTLKYIVRISNSSGSDKTGVTFNAPTPANTTLGTITATPLARGDAPAANSIPGDVFHTAMNTTLNTTSSGPKLLDNDFLGNPGAAIEEFGNGSVGVTHLAGSTVNLGGGGSITVNANGSFVFTPANNYVGYFTFEYKLANSTGSSVGAVTFAVGTRPNAVNESYSVTGNTMIDTSLGLASLIANDTGDQISITAHTAPPQGTVNRTGADFTYLPNLGITGAGGTATDSFTYTLSNGLGDSTGTVTLNVTGEVFYIDGSVAVNGDGRSSSPFKTLADFGAVNIGVHFMFPGPGDSIFIHQGTYQRDVSGGAALTLHNDQKVIGDGWSGTFNQAFGFNLAPGSARAPGVPFTPFTGNDPVIVNTAAGGNGIALNTGNTLRGLTVGNTPNGFSFTGGAVGTFIIEDCSKTGTGGAIQITTSGVAGSVTLPNFNILESSSSSGANLSLVGVTGTLSISPGGTGLANSASGSAAVNVSGGSVAFTYPSAITKNNNGAAVNVAGGHTGTLAFNGSLNATGGTGLQFNNADGTYNFNGIATLTDGDAGIDIVNGSSGNFSFANAPITNPSGAGFLVAGGNGTISHTGTIAKNNSGLLVDIQSRTGGTISFNGNLAATVSSGGILCQNNSGGAVTFAGGTKTLSTSGNPAVTLLNNSGVTVSFNGGGLDIDTGSGVGFTATGGGTITVQGSNNTIDSTSATALNVVSTTISASGLSFSRISSGNNTAAADPVNGIVLNTTGSSGGLTVTGTGADHSGGTIQNTTGDAIALTNTRNVSFDEMNIQNTGGSGVDGTGVTNFTFKNSTIAGSGNAAFEANLAFNDQVSGTENNLSGVVVITKNILSTAFDSGIDLVNGSGTLSDLSITENTLTSATSSSSSKGSGILIDLRGSASSVANLTKAAITGNTIANFPSGAGIKVLGGNSDSSGPAATIGTMGSPIDVIQIIANSIQGQSAVAQMGANGIEVAVNGKGQGNFDISDNTTINHLKGTGVAVSVFGLATVTAAVDNNTILANNTLSSPGMAIGVDRTSSATDTPLLTATISNNHVSQSQGNGLLAGALNSQGTANLDIANNTVAAPTAGVRQGIRIESGTPLAAGTDTSLCLHIAGNVSAGSGGTVGIGLRKEGTSTSVNTFNIEGMAATASPGVESYVNGLNPFGSGTLLIASASGFGNCAIP